MWAVDEALEEWPEELKKSDRLYLGYRIVLVSFSMGG